MAVGALGPEASQAQAGHLVTRSQRVVREKTGYLVPAAFAGELAALPDWQLRLVRDLLDSGRTVQLPQAARMAHGAKRAAWRRWLRDLTGR